MAFVVTCSECKETSREETSQAAMHWLRTHEHVRPAEPTPGASGAPMARVTVVDRDDVEE